MSANTLPHLWDRLVLLDRSCDLQVSNARSGQAEDDGQGTLVWLVKVTRRDDRGQSRTVQAASLPEALSGAVLAATEAGWASWPPAATGAPAPR